MRHARKRPTVVLDAGGRYGLHPTWKPFRGELDYRLFEPDPVEARRLAAKYASRSGEVAVEALALAQKPGTITLNLFHNRAMSSSAVRLPVSALFHGEREREVEVVDSIEVSATTIDMFCDQHELQADFLKLDTEGTEFEILQGAERQFAGNILGVRAEVSFERTFVGKVLFGQMHEFMLEHEFYLLNLDYEGRGEYQNEFARVDGRYGILAASDAVWMRRKSGLFDIGEALGSMEFPVLKYAAFCFHNFAPDVAIDVLLDARNRGADYLILKGTRLLAHVDNLVHHHLYSLKWVPGQSLRRNEQVYHQIFGCDMKTLNAFMESTELNPD